MPDYNGVPCKERAARRAGRATWEKAHGPIPKGLHVLHRCDNPPCEELSHLFLGTNADNVRDKVAKGRQAVKTGRLRSTCKLTEEEARQVKALLAEGLSQRKIASRFGVSQGLIWQISHGISWAGV